MEIFSQIPIKTRISHLSFSLQCSFTFILFYLLLLLPLTAAAAASLYSQHCGDIVRPPPLLPNPDPPILDRQFLSLRHAYVSPDKSNHTNKDDFAIPHSLSFFSTRVYTTKNDAVFKVEALLTLHGVVHRRRRLRLVHFRSPRFPATSDGALNAYRYSLDGFWDSASGKLCMIGSGLGRFTSNHVLFKLDYSNSSSIFNSLVNGTLEPLTVGGHDSVDLASISILGVNLRSYKYELIDKEIQSNGFLLDDLANVSLGTEDLSQKLCSYIRSAGSLELEYKSDCNSVNCNFLGSNAHPLPSEMYFNEIDCVDDGRVRFLLGFGGFVRNGYRMTFEPGVTLVSEGKWDGENRWLNMVGCRIFTDSDDFVGECLIRLSLRFPASWTLRNRSSVVGELWSSRNVGESGYFGRVSLRSLRNKNVRGPVLRYEYTEIEKAKRFCENKVIQKGKGEYPNAISSDMRFNMLVENKKVKYLWGYTSPVYVDNRLYQLPFMFEREGDSALQIKQNLSGLINVSYVLSLSTSNTFNLNKEFKQVNSFDISAEGTYNSTNGHLCMIGCIHVRLPRGEVRQNSSLDCEILVDISYPSLQQRNEGTVKGTIESTRKKSDPLYFDPFEIHTRSIYATQAKESIWRMDLEITMVLISNTLLCIFIGLQLLHVKRHPDVLPLISIVMLIVLTLAHMVPLLLNFEALFMWGRRNVNIYFDSDGWLEVNEVLVRVITMVAFILEFRLLQMSWSARSNDGNPNDFWTSDKKVLYLSLPMYIFGGLIAGLVHWSRKSNEKPWVGLHHRSRSYYKQQSIWGGLKSYAGLILDGFLFPQILFNLFSDTQEKALAPFFYVGTTVVRLMPHAYDLYRSHSSTWSFDYIYANPRLDYYSISWNIIISTGGLLFIVLIYLQQRYGGRCLVPKRFMGRLTYEKLPMDIAMSNIEGR